ILAHLGVGYLEAAINLQRLLVRFPAINSVTFCGTAGIYPQASQLQIGDTCRCSEVILCDASAETGRSAYVPLLKNSYIDADLIGFGDLKSAKVVTTLSITIDDECARVIGENTGYHVENLELYGIALLCNTLKLPWNAVLGLTNNVGSNGRLEWSQNHLQVEKNMNQFLTIL
ncbi:MAG: hypothetical protein GY786_21755, partial [Proteobacteria bacterium]|nr:hypothetical protein [Pseudomonadota bacterium]